MMMISAAWGEVMGADVGSGTHLFVVGESAWLHGFIRCHKDSAYVVHVNGLVLEQFISMQRPTALSQQIGKSFTEHLFGILIEAFIMELNGFDQKLDWEATLVTAEILV